MAEGADEPVVTPEGALLPPPKKQLRFLPTQSQVFFFLVLGLSVYLTWTIFRGFFVYMVTGVFVAVLALPVDRFWEKFFPNRVAAFCTMFTLFVLITLPMLIIGFFLLGDVREVADELRDGQLNEWVNQTLEVFEPVLGQQSVQERNETVAAFVQEVEQRAEQLLESLASGLLAGASEFFIGLTVILFVVYYVLTDGSQLVAYLRRASPLPPKQVDYLLGEANRGLKAVFVGQILTSVIQGTVGGFMFLVLGVPGAILWAIVMMVLSLLPVVGAFLVWIPAAIYLFINAPPWKGIAMLAWGILVVSQIDNLVRPRLIGNRADIHPLFVLLGVLGGVAAFGFIGLFLGPLLVGVTISILRVWESDYLDPAINLHHGES